MSRLDPSVITLDKGLNLQTAKILAPAGSALSSLNYEQVDFQGQKRIEGYARYDGNILSAIDEYYLIDASLVTVTEGLAFVGDKFLGRVLEGTTTLTLAVYDFKLLDTLSYQTGTEVDTYSNHYTKLLAYNAMLRSVVESLPGAVSGLHWFNDRLYAVADMAVILLAGTNLGLTVNTQVEDVYDYFPPRTVLKWTQLETDTLVFLSGGSLKEWEDAGVDSIAPVGSSCLQYTVSSYSPTVDVTQYPASIFEARTEVQATTEDATIVGADYGWKFKHTGWLIDYNQGLLPYGGFTALNQNRQGVGVQGPTSITGNNGRPLTLLQKVNITNAQAQVNGWKTSSTPTSYNLDPLALQERDTAYVYADFYVEWNSSSGVTTPDATPVLIERPATATVEVNI